MSASNRAAKRLAGEAPAADHRADGSHIEQGRIALGRRQGLQCIVDVRSRIFEASAFGIGVAVDRCHALLNPPRCFDGTALLDLAQNREQKRLVDLSQRHRTQMREDVALEAGDDIVGVHRLPARDLQ